MANKAYCRAFNKANKIALDTPFSGVPFLIKDMIDTANLPHTDGSRLFQKRIPACNVSYIEAVEQAGLNIIGNTNCPEMASTVVTSNNLFGTTNNPWDLEYSVFSSSGGSAAAVAAGVLPIAHGTDGAGSNRLPASTTNLFGMKPSYGRTLCGESNGQHDIAKTNQTLRKTVRDSAQLFALTEDKNCSIYDGTVGFVQEPIKRKLRIGCIRSINNGLETDLTTQMAMKKTMKVLTELGHTIIVLDDIEHPISDYNLLHQAYVAFFAKKTRSLIPAVEAMTGKRFCDSDLLTPMLKSFIMQNHHLDNPADEYLTSLPKQYDHYFSKYDLLLTPVSPVASMKSNELTPNSEWSDATAHFIIHRLQFTAGASFGHTPAMSVPLYIDKKTQMPTGSQFTAARGDERTLFELAYQLELHESWNRKWAPHSLMYTDNLQDR